MPPLAGATLAVFDIPTAQQLFDKVDTAKPKNQKSLRAAGQFLQDTEFGVAVVVVSTGGTGDILTGIVAGLLAQNVIAQNMNTQNPNAALLAVCAAVHLHGLSGDVMRETVGEHSLVATDLLQGLPEAFRRAQRSAQEKSACWHG